MSSSSRALDRIGVMFDEPSLVAEAGLLLPATLVIRLGLERLINETVSLAGRIGGAHAGRKVLTLVFAILAGASHIDHADRLRAGATRRVLPFRVMAPSTLGIFLRLFTFGHVRQLEAVTAEALRRAWRFGAGPGNKAMTIDLDSTIVPVHGYKKGGAAYGYTRHLGYHPLLATRSDTGELLHARLRKGSANTQRGAKRFVDELVARVRRCGATGPLSLRADSGFYSRELIRTCERLGVAYSITVNLNASVQAAIEEIEDDAWQKINYTDGGEAEVAETTYVTGGGKTKRKQHRLRLVVRRTRICDPAVQQLFPTWRHHAFVTNVALDAVAADAFHREHATVELAIRDLKEGAGLEHCPSGRFFANAAWLCCAVLALDLVRWTSLLGGTARNGVLTVARTVRRQLSRCPVGSSTAPAGRRSDSPSAGPGQRSSSVPSRTSARSHSSPERASAAKRSRRRAPMR